MAQPVISPLCLVSGLNVRSVEARAWREADWFGGIVEAVLSAKAVPLPENTVPSAGRAPQTGETGSGAGGKQVFRP